MKLHGPLWRLDLTDSDRRALLAAALRANNEASFRALLDWSERVDSALGDDKTNVLGKVSTSHRKDEQKGRAIQGNVRGNDTQHDVRERPAHIGSPSPASEEALRPGPEPVPDRPDQTGEFIQRLRYSSTLANIANAVGDTLSNAISSAMVAPHVAVKAAWEAGLGLFLMCLRSKTMSY